MPTRPLALLALLVAAMACRESGTEPSGERPPRPEDRLPGAAADPAAAAVVARAFVARAEDYSTDHPQLPGLPLSFNTAMLALTPSATVGDVNALLDDAGAEIVGGIPGVAGQAGGILFLRLPTKSHGEMETLLARLRQRPVVAVLVQDALLEGQAVPRPNAGTPSGWAWEVAPTGGNWGLEAMRVPQMWNLNRAMLKAGTQAVTVTGIFDVGFDVSHADLTLERLPGDNVVNDHGTHVAGTIGATFDNGVGVDGVTPFARLVVHGPLFTGSILGATASRVSVGAAMISELEALLNGRPDVRVVNLSLGYNWYRVGVNTTTSAVARLLADAQGALFADLLRSLAARGVRLPVIVVAAGNDSDPGPLGGFPNQDAKYASPMANAGLARGAAPVIVVEADSLVTATGALTRSPFSNSGGHVSAPGSLIVSTVAGSGYGTQSGTSMAAPHVTGLVSYLYSLDPALPAPTMTSNPIRDLLLANAVAVAGAAPRVDAFASAMDVDRVRGGDRVLRLLVDVDDGTPDGNTRLSAIGAVVTGDDADGDGGPGDGRVDMSDFRRWRDWLLQAELAPGLSLDGAADHPKRDLNGDGRVGAASAELVHARGDFNGDGIISRTLTRAVPGVMANRAVTDLQVLQQLFSDSIHSAAELPGLINSADLVVRADRCLAGSGVASVRSFIQPVGAAGAPGRSETRTHTASSPSHVYTAAVTAAGYTARAEALDVAGVVIGSAEQDFPFRLGGDAAWEPVCGAMELTLVFPPSVDAGTVAPLSIQAGLRDSTGAVTFSAGVTIEITATGGSVSPASGATDAAGRFTAVATASSGSTTLVLAVTARGPGGESATRTVTATVRSPGVATFLSSSFAVGATATAHDSVGGAGGSRTDSRQGTATSGNADLTADAEIQSGGGAGLVHASLTGRLTGGAGGSEFSGGSCGGAARASATVSGSGFAGGGGASTSSYVLRFRVGPGPVTMRLTASLTGSVSSASAPQSGLVNLKVQLSQTEPVTQNPVRVEPLAVFGQSASVPVERTVTLAPGDYVLTIMTSSGLGANVPASVEGRFTCAFAFTQ